MSQEEYIAKLEIRDRQIQGCILARENLAEEFAKECAKFKRNERVKLKNQGVEDMYRVASVKFNTQTMTFSYRLYQYGFNTSIQESDLEKFYEYSFQDCEHK